MKEEKKIFFLFAVVFVFTFEVVYAATQEKIDNGKPCRGPSGSVCVSNTSVCTEGPRKCIQFQQDLENCGSGEVCCEVPLEIADSCIVPAGVPDNTELPPPDDVDTVPFVENCGTGMCVLNSCTNCIVKGSVQCGEGQFCCLEFSTVDFNPPRECVPPNTPPGGDTDPVGCSKGECKLACDQTELGVPEDMCIDELGGTGECCIPNPNVDPPKDEDPYSCSLGVCKAECAGTEEIVPGDFCEIKKNDFGICCTPLEGGVPPPFGNPPGGSLPALDCDSRTKPVGNVCVPTGIGTGGLSERTVSEIVVGFMMVLLGIFGVLAVIAFVVSGFMYLTSAGDESRATKAKTYMIWAIVGVIVGMSGLIILNVIRNLLEGSDRI